MSSLLKNSPPRRQSHSQKTGNILSKSWLLSALLKAHNFALHYLSFNGTREQSLRPTSKTVCFFGKAMLMASFISGSFFPGLRQRCSFKDRSPWIYWPRRESYSFPAMTSGSKGHASVRRCRKGKQTQHSPASRTLVHFQKCSGNIFVSLKTKVII